MAERIAAAIDGDERLLVEAGTGTGKTLAYLVPALLSGRKVVVSTGTKTLQDQIATRRPAAPAPIFAAAGIGDQNLEWAVMKGLGNYVCRRRLGERERQQSPGRRPRASSACWPSPRATPTGDRAELAELADDSPLWREVAATPETRIGPRCAYFESCFVTAMRRRAAAAPLVIVNHHLFFADLALRARWPEAQVLPPYEVVIFDEAHQIEDVATEFFGVHVSTQRLFALARDLGRETRRRRPRAPQSAAARLTAAAAALGRRAPRPVPPPRARRRRDARALPRRSRRRPAPAPPTTSSTACSRRSPPGSIPTAARWRDSRRPAEVGGARPARGRRCATDLSRADRRARARPRPLAAAPRRATSRCTPRRSTSGRCSGARSTPARGRSSSPRRR